MKRLIYIDFYNLFYNNATIHASKTFSAISQIQHYRNEDQKLKMVEKIA